MAWQTSCTMVTKVFGAHETHRTVNQSRPRGASRVGVFLLGAGFNLSNRSWNRPGSTLFLNILTSPSCNCCKSFLYWPKSAIGSYHSDPYHVLCQTKQFFLKGSNMLDFFLTEIDFHILEIHVLYLIYSFYKHVFWASTVVRNRNAWKGLTVWQSPSILPGVDKRYQIFPNSGK